jgi:hypothetical protein
MRAVRRKTSEALIYHVAQLRNSGLRAGAFFRWAEPVIASCSR